MFCVSTCFRFAQFVQQGTFEKKSSITRTGGLVLFKLFHILIRKGEPLSVEIHWQLIRTFSSAACLLRLARDRAMNEGAVRRGQPKAARCLFATPSLSDLSTGHAKPITREAFKKSPYLSQASPGQLADPSPPWAGVTGGRPSFQRGH